MVTAVMAGLTALIAWRQLTNLSQTGKAEFWHKFKTDFFTKESVTLISLIEYDLLIFHDTEIPTFSVKKNNIIPNNITYTTTELDHLLLGHFEDLGLFEKKSIVSMDMIYETFSEYIERAWKNDAIQKYITVTANGNYADTYSNFRYIYEKCIIYGQNMDIK